MEELKLAVLLEPARTRESVVEVCRRHGVSRASYYRYRRRYLAEGVDGLEARSRRPRSSPGRIAAELELAIVMLRKKHPRWGARRIQVELARAGVEPPGVATVHRALKRNHLVAPQPPRRRKASRRFERDVANDLWQIDATQVELVGERPAWVVDCLDDHARFLLAAIAVEGPTGEAAWACFAAASSAHGLPRQLLSDNHLSFTGRLYGLEVAFERKLAEIGVQMINSAPAHPQTLGKLERFHRTLKEWLADEGPPLDLQHLQLLLDRFRGHYNSDRPHQGIGNQTPAERFRPGRAPLGELTLTESVTQAAYPAYSQLRLVDQRGTIYYDGLRIILPRRYTGATVRVLTLGEIVHVYLADELLRALAPDRNRPYQTIGNRKPRRH